MLASEEIILQFPMVLMLFLDLDMDRLDQLLLV
jgi:hypothetical protein